MTTAKLFWTGNSQALRLPKAFRFSGDEVRIRKQGNRVIIEPIVTDWSFLDDIRAIGEPDPTLEESIKQLREEAQSPVRDWSCFE